VLSAAVVALCVFDIARSERWWLTAIGALAASLVGFVFTRALAPRVERTDGTALPLVYVASGIVGTVALGCWIGCQRDRRRVPAWLDGRNGRPHGTRPQSRGDAEVAPKIRVYARGTGARRRHVTSTKVVNQQ